MQRAMLAMSALAAVTLTGLALGLGDFVLPVATGGQAFGAIERPTDQESLFLLAMRAFVHNWGVALVLPVIGGVAVHFEPRMRLVARILLVAVLVGSVAGFLVLPPPLVGTREVLLLALEILGITAGAVLAYRGVAEGRPGPTLEDTCRAQLQRTWPAIAVSGILLLWAMTFEARIIGI